MQDPEAIANWPLTLSRDGARTPMPWHGDCERGGFSAAKPWLPVAHAHRALAVDRQEGDPASLLNLTRRLLALRKAHPVLQSGACDILLVDQARLALRRADADEMLVALFNLSDAEVDWPGELVAGGTVIESVNGAEIGRLPPYAAILIREKI